MHSCFRPWDLDTMASLKDMISDASLEGVHCVSETSAGRYVCYTRMLDDAWVVGTTDGCDLWRIEMDSEELDAHRDLADSNSMDAYLSRIKAAFTTGDIQVSQIGANVKLRFGQPPGNFDLKLYEAKAMEKKMEIQSLLLRLADLTKDLDKKLEKANNTIDTLKQQQGNAGARGGVFDIDAKKKKAQLKGPPKQAGMSVINPGSKKRKVTKGVEFD